MIVAITDTAELLDVLHCSVIRHRQCLSDPTTCKQEVVDEIVGIRGTQKALERAMPQLVFASGFWKELMDYVDSHSVNRHLAALAATHGITPREARGLFFEGVVEACRMLQTVSPTPRPRGMWWWFGGGQLPPPPSEDEGALVYVMEEQLGKIRIRRMIGRIVVSGIAP